MPSMIEYPNEPGGESCDERNERVDGRVQEPAEALITAATNPCGSCPYRRDVPSGVWDESEYLKLPDYDAPTYAQPFGPFFCHQQNGKLCSGWLGCHDKDNLLALRLFGRKMDASVFTYQTDVPLFSSGAEACAHGLKDVEEPSPEAEKVIARLVAKRKKK